MPMLSPNEAAKLSGVSRRSIMRAIEAGELTARRNNKNQWQIEAENLAHWAPTAQPMRTEETAQLPAPTPPIDMINTEFLIQSLRDLIDAEKRISDAANQRADTAERRADAAESDRDAWREMAQRSWWKRLVG
jgi:excisionase family DNA binding protein